MQGIELVRRLVKDFNEEGYTFKITNNNIQNINTMFDNTASNRFRIRM